MSQPIDIEIDLSIAKDYEEFSGLTRDHFTHDGIFMLAVEEFDVVKGKNNTNAEIRFVAVDDDNKGRKTFVSLPLTGNDKNGKANILRLIALIAHAHGLDEAAARGMAASGKQSARALLTAVLKPGTQVAAKLETEEYKGRKQSNIAWTVSKDEYAKAKASGAWRQPHVVRVSNQQQVATPPAGFMTPPGGTAPGAAPVGIPGLGFTPPAGAPAPAASGIPGFPAAPPAVAAPPVMNGAPPAGIPGMANSLGQLFGNQTPTA